MLEALSGSVQASALDLSQNGIATLVFQDKHRRLYHVSTLMVGRLGDLWEWIVLATTKGQNRFRIVHTFSHSSHFFRIFPLDFSLENKGFLLNENKREEKIIKRTGQIDVAR